jgi:hypothetical protein
LTNVTFTPWVITPAVGIGVTVPLMVLDVAGGGARIQGIQNPASGHGIELGYDGTQGVVQSFSDRAALTFSPISYDASKHTFQINTVTKLTINSTGLGIGADALIAPLDVRGIGFMQGLIVEPTVANANRSLVLQNVNNPTNPLAITWGTSTDPWTPPGGSDAFAA